MVLLQVDVAAALLHVGLDILGVNLKAPIQVGQSLGEGHQLHVGRASIAVVLGLLGAPPDGFLVLLDGLRETALLEQLPALEVMLLSQLWVDVGLFISILLLSLDPPVLVLDGWVLVL